eukprot:SAG22_NODE_4173_length_1358_cov_5.849881_1_plen_63_part_10
MPSDSTAQRDRFFQWLPKFSWQLPTARCGNHDKQFRSTRHGSYMHAPCLTMVVAAAAAAAAAA